MVVLLVRDERSVAHGLAADGVADGLAGGLQSARDAVEAGKQGQEQRDARHQEQTDVEQVDQRLQVPIKVEMKVGSNWYAAEPMG